MERLTDEELGARYGAPAMAWINQLQGRNIGNDAIVSLNYRTGAVVAYVGSANFYGEVTPIHQPQYDVVGQCLPPVGIGLQADHLRDRLRDGTITPATMFMDIETECPATRSTMRTTTSAGRCGPATR